MPLTTNIRQAAALQVATELDDIAQGAVLFLASMTYACTLNGSALVTVMTNAFDACAKRSVDEGDIRPAAEPALMDLDETVFRYRRGVRAAMKSLHGEGNLLSAAHTGRLVRLQLAQADSSAVSMTSVSAQPAPPTHGIPEGYTIHAGTIHDGETGDDDTIYQWEHVSGEVSGYLEGDGRFVRSMFGSWSEALADIMEHSAPDTAT